MSVEQEVSVNGLVHFGEKIAVIIFYNGKSTDYNSEKIYKKDVKKIIVYVVVKFILGLNFTVCGYGNVW